MFWTAGNLIKHISGENVYTFSNPITTLVKTLDNSPSRMEISVGLMLTLLP